MTSRSAGEPVLVNSQLITHALLMHMTYSDRLVWPQQWHTQTRGADGILLYRVDYLYAPAVVNSEVSALPMCREASWGTMGR